MINLYLSFILQKDELSITLHPIKLSLGASSFEVSEPAERSAK